MISAPKWPNSDKDANHAQQLLLSYLVFNGESFLLLRCFLFWQLLERVLRPHGLLTAVISNICLWPPCPVNSARQADLDRLQIILAELQHLTCDGREIIPLSDTVILCMQPLNRHPHLRSVIRNTSSGLLPTGVWLCWWEKQSTNQSSSARHEQWPRAGLDWCDYKGCDTCLWTAL